MVKHDRRSRRLKRARARAPKHPKGPEARIRLAVSKLFGTYHAEVKATVLRDAIAYSARKNQSSKQSDRQALYNQRVTAKRSKKFKNPIKNNDDHVMWSAYTGLWNYGKLLLARSPFKHDVKKATKDTAKSASKQVAKALDLNPERFSPDLSAPEADLYDAVVLGADAGMADSLDRASDILEEWSDLGPDTSPRAGDLDALDGMLDGGLLGIVGTALQGATLAYGSGFADMNRDAQEEAGVGSYIWVSQNDSVVRPEHRALDGLEATWDDPPLSAEDSDSGEECHPGEDYNCRCVAAPISPDEGEPN